MFFKKNKVEVVPESEWTDYGDQYATKKHLAIAMCVPTAASVGLVAWNSLQRIAESPVQEVVSTTSGIANQTTLNTIPVNAITDKGGELAGEMALSTFATIMDPILDILVALSLPVASVILVGSLFMIMLGQKEKAYGLMMNAGLGYVLIQMSPLLLKILEASGNAVQPS
ncbi:hypothetical protein CW357_01160 [Rummeliibacillus sp. TYF005]|uniref:hypothetical protein n=1 Tax=Rummeliibacillus sp. TYF005 TaxID=2058214 RepID=UPI000F51EC4F|nr:hypothetical protein [Rummeliibacillus sp. TYF005]RPJ97304.1 hypothetical protein CW357_01160 [Rummeliibacillus sp. TYF005]